MPSASEPRPDADDLFEATLCHAMTFDWSLASMARVLRASGASKSKNKVAALLDFALFVTSLLVWRLVARACMALGALFPPKGGRP